MEINTIESILLQYDFNLSFAKKLVEDLDKVQMTTSPYPGFENHPAFTLGHLVTGSAMMAEDLGGTYDIPEGWKELFQRNGPGDPRMPSGDLNSYPEKNVLLNELEKQHEIVKEILRNIDEKKLNESVKWRFDKFFPSLLDLTFFICVNHEAMHLGQLSAWRRAMKLPTALGAL